MPRKREPKIYATLQRRFGTGELVQLGFQQDGSQMAKRGAGRVTYATASSLDGLCWRVTPLVRRWR
jgi:hypothetical protein